MFIGMDQAESRLKKILKVETLLYGWTQSTTGSYSTRLISTANRLHRSLSPFKLFKALSNTPLKKIIMPTYSTWMPVKEIYSTFGEQKQALYIPGLEDFSEAHVSFHQVSSGPNAGKKTLVWSGKSMAMRLKIGENSSARSYWNYAEYLGDHSRRLDWCFREMISPLPALFTKPCCIMPPLAKNPFRQERVYEVTSGPAWSPLTGWVYLKKPRDPTSLKASVLVHIWGSIVRPREDDLHTGCLVQTFDPSQGLSGFLEKISFYSAPFTPAIVFTG